MIFIVVKFKVKPDWSERWLGPGGDFTQATRQEPGNLWFDWSRSVEDPNEFVLVEAFKTTPPGTTSTAPTSNRLCGHAPGTGGDSPDHSQFDGEGWDRMGELTISNLVVPGKGGEALRPCGSAGLNSMSSSAMSTA